MKSLAVIELIKRQTILRFGHGCSGKPMHSEHERDDGLGLNFLVMAVRKKTNVILVWVWLLWQAYAIGFRQYSVFGMDDRGSSGWAAEKGSRCTTHNAKLRQHTELLSVPAQLTVQQLIFKALAHQQAVAWQRQDFFSTSAFTCVSASTVPRATNPKECACFTIYDVSSCDFGLRCNFS